MISTFDPAICAGTPTVTVLDNRNLTVREIVFHRAKAGGDTDTLITRHQYDLRGNLTQSLDPRLYDLMQKDNTVQPNFYWQHDLLGRVLHTVSIDAGGTVTLSDIEDRPALNVNAMGVVKTWQYEANSLPGRLLSVSEQSANEAVPRVIEHFIWAGNSQAEKDLNLAGQYMRHYDTAGLDQLNSLSLTGAHLSQSLQLLKDDQMPDWAGDNESVWQNKLKNEVHTTQSTTDATGAPLTQTDAKENMQRLAYNVTGQLKSSWLTLNGQLEQIIVKSLAYSESGQKIREEHGNGVVTKYSYEPDTQRLINITTQRSKGHVFSEKLLQDLLYEYDPVGNIVSILNRAEATHFWRNQKVSPRNTYTYDSLYQLIQSTGREMADIGQQNNKMPTPLVPLSSDDKVYTTYTRTYSYDRGNNLTKIQHRAPASHNIYTTEITVSNRSNRAVLSHNGLTPREVDAQFDASGHQISLPTGQNLSWNQRGELQQATTINRDNSATDREWYRYNAGSARILKVSEQQTGNSTQQQQVTYLPGLELRTTKSGTNTTEDLQVITMVETERTQVRILHWSAGKPNDIANNQVRYSYDNLIESNVMELDTKGKIISQEEYYPYGGTAIWTARNQIEASYKTVRYSGKERDKTGLYYYRHRYYQPWLGRWLSADPAGTVDGLNLYRMVKNNPIRYQDESGTNANDKAQAIFKEGKKIAINQLKIASNFLKDSKNSENALEIYRIFFGGHQDIEQLPQWKKRIDSVIYGLDKLKTTKHVHYQQDKSGSSSTVADLNVDEYKKWSEGNKSIYVNVYADALKRVYEDPLLGREHVAHIAIHELSHGVLRTQDHKYIGVLSSPGSHDLTDLLSILMPPANEQDRTEKQRRATGARKALENADSFTLSARYLYYTAQDPNFLSSLRKAHRDFNNKKTDRLIIRPPERR
ncbi:MULTISPECIES: RHS repeat domain-containing protein [Photorhabdus]|uniref:Insecticidal toxin complex TccC n=2 Tax=Photorhabdus asymbiotica TaxID=291112 RepID=C7BJB9_PHOAA|nr:RHS repeat domain-containing protein [Photorhabdus asymbiotica]RKS65924.1 insecticidal toxin complex protein TccC [Photorhabdus asymbiotica]CAQ84187.1 insecticidal toxin complex TccC [Photorhabdus asymbiotica]